jgi:holin-like protein
MRRALEAGGGLALLAALSLGGDALARVTGASIPGPVVGLLLLLAGLGAFGRVPRGLGVAARALIGHLNLSYIPAAVAVTAYAALLRRDALPIAVALVVGTWLALAAGALTFQLTARLVNRRGP